MPLPTFVCVGTQRAGTTWLFDALSEHPQVFIPDFKEIHYFRGWGKPSMWETYGAGLYESFFKGSEDFPCRADFSPGVLAGEHAAEWMHGLMPDVKFVVQLRDPAERAHSHYTFASGRRPLPFTIDELAANPDMEDPYEILSDGFYARALKRFFKYYSRDQFLILYYEELMADSRAFLHRICDFVGIDREFEPQVLHTKVNEARQYKSPLLYSINMQVGHFLNTRGLSSVRQAIKSTGIPALVRKVGTQPLPKSPLKPETRRALVEIYRRDVEELEELLGRDLSAWRTA